MNMRVICLLFEEVQKVFLFFLPEVIKDTTFSIVKESKKWIDEKKNG